MVKKSDYDTRIVQACKGVIIELVDLMVEFRNHMAIVGGWVPSLLIPGAEEAHVGTKDVDIALDFTRISSEAYATILKLLGSRGYEQDKEQPFRFYRRVSTSEGEPLRVEVDFLAGEYGGTGGSRRTQVIQDIRARKARGCDLVFDSTVSVTIEGELPSGGKDKVTCKVAGVVPFLVMKGVALRGRRNAKDLYDIYYCVRNYPNGDELSKVFGPWMAHELVKEALGNIRDKFQSIEHVGPKEVVDFLELQNDEEKELMRRRVFETIDEWLRALGF